MRRERIIINRCEVCGIPVEIDYLVPELNRVIHAHPICECRKKEIEERDNLIAAKEAQRRLNRFNAYTLIDEKYISSTFENWLFRADNKKLYTIGKRYCENWTSIKASNNGLLLHGIAGNGKTYLAFAIANELNRRNQTILVTSIRQLLQLMKESYNNHNNMIQETEILNAIHNVDLLVLDDLGSEYKTSWSYEKLFAIIDTRYRSGLPLIVTTNYSIDDLMRRLSIIEGDCIDHTDRIYSRISEMCAIIELKGESWRIQKGLNKTQKLIDELFTDRDSNDNKYKLELLEK